MTPQRFLIIAWPEDHDEALAEHACNIQDCLDILEVGGARVIAPISNALSALIAAEVGEFCP